MNSSHFDPILSSCPICEAKLLTDEDGGVRSCEHCSYQEDLDSHNHLCKISKVFTKYIQSMGVEYISLNSVKIDVESAIAPSALLPLILVRTRQIMELSGIVKNITDEWPFQLVSDKKSLLGNRVVVDSNIKNYNPTMSLLWIGETIHEAVDMNQKLYSNEINILEIDYFENTASESFALQLEDSIQKTVAQEFRNKELA